MPWLGYDLLFIKGPWIKMTETGVLKGIGVGWVWEVHMCMKMLHVYQVCINGKFNNSTISKILLHHTRGSLH